MSYNYKIFCEDDQKWESFDSLMPREVCPINPTHTIRQGSMSLIGESNSDYKVLRENLMIQVATEGFANLTLEEKEIASSHFCVLKVDRDTVHTIKEQIENGIIFHKKSVDSRKLRRNAAEGEVYNRIQDGLEQSDLMNDVITMLDTYVNFGIEGTLEGDLIGLFDYLESRVGTPFEGAGLLEKTYTVEGMTIAQLSVKLMDIFKGGIY